AGFRPDVVGLGLRNLHDNSYGSSEPLLGYYDEVAAALRGAAPEAPLVLGGAAITLQPAGLVERLRAAHAVVGEGERVFRELLDTMARGARAERILLPAAAAAAATERVVAPAALVRSAPPERPRDLLDELPAPARDL